MGIEEIGNGELFWLYLQYKLNNLLKEIFIIGEREKQYENEYQFKISSAFVSDTARK
jgi:hypothetical protein